MVALAEAHRGEVDESQLATAKTTAAMSATEPRRAFRLSTSTVFPPCRCCWSAFFWFEFIFIWRFHTLNSGMLRVG